MMDPQTGELATYWRGILGTLAQRGLLHDRPRQGGTVVPEADGYLFLDRAVYVLDMQRLAGISREKWLDVALWAQMRAALQGRRVFVSDGGGLAVCVARQPGTHVKRLPRVIPLTPEEIPPQAYHVNLGYTRRGAVILDLAGLHRAILTGGASGSGKTNMLQSFVLQLASKHSPAECKIAVVDLKEVDFSGPFDRLPHLFDRIAHDVAEAGRLIEGVEQERLRRQALMARANVADWRYYNAHPLDGEPLPLVYLICDEAADLKGTPAMDTLITLARKGRAFGISLSVGTQSPTSDVVHAQVRANLDTPIAYKTRTHIESQVILGRKGAETLERPGQALAYLGGKWETIQTLRVTHDADTGEVGGLVDLVTAPPPPALDDLEAGLVAYAVDDLDGCFIIGRLYERFTGQISKRRLATLAQQWQARGWLTAPAHATDPRRVTPELLSLCPPSPSPGQGQRGDDRVIGMIGGDRTPWTVTGAVTGGAY